MGLVDYFAKIGLFAHLNQTAENLQLFSQNWPVRVSESQAAAVCKQTAGGSQEMSLARYGHDHIWSMTSPSFPEAVAYGVYVCVGEE